MSDEDNNDKEMDSWLLDTPTSSGIPIDSHDHPSSSEPHSSPPRANEVEVKVPCPMDVVETSRECNTPRRRPSNETRNHLERIRRKKVKERVFALRDLVPNCNKGDMASILDDTVMYIKTLKHQHQIMLTMMPMRPGGPMCYPPVMTRPQPGLQGMQGIGPFPRTGYLGGGTGMGMGMSAMYPSFNYPMCQLGLPYQHLSTSVATSALPATGGIPAATHPDQYAGNVLEALPPATSSMELVARQGNFSGFQSTIGWEGGPSHVAPSTTKGKSPIINVISEVPATSTLPVAPGGIPAAHSIQYPVNDLESLPAAFSSMKLEAQHGTIGGESGPSHGAPSSTKETSSSINVISEVGSTSTLPAAPAGIPAAHSYQYPGNVLESLPSAFSSMKLEARHGTFSGFQPTNGGESGLSHGAPSGTMETSPSINVIREVPSTSTLPVTPGGIPAAHSVQYPGNVLESLSSSTSSMVYATSSGFQSTIGGKNGPSQGAPSTSKESSQNVKTIREENRRTRFHLFSFSNYGTYCGPSSSTTRPENSFTGKTWHERESQTSPQMQLRSM